MKLDEASLREAALRHLSRFAATEAGLRRVLGNRIRRWAREAEQAGQDPDAIRTETVAAQARAAAIAARLVQAGAVDDAAFAVARARRLRGAGRSAAAAMAHLAAKGVSAETARAALAHEEVPDELTAALRLCRRRRIGPFGDPDAPPETRRKWQGILGRGGFGGGVARQALGMDRAEAEDHLAGPRGP